MSSTESALVTVANIQHLQAYDYVSPGMTQIFPDAAFPDMIVGDTSLVDWPFLRRWIEHNWYTDQHDPTTGFANRDEVTIIYNNACLFKGKSSLEIGCWRGWSAVHIARGTGKLDVIDPIFSDPAIVSQIRTSLADAGVLDRVALHTGFSPDAVDALAGDTGTRWSFIFIDGNHDDEGPRRDAEAVMRNAADTAMVVFHDLASPHVAAGLRAMRDAGWNTMLYQTMQIMGIAWRGDVEPVRHLPDPKIFWTLPRHLAGFPVSGWTAPSPRLNDGWWDGMTTEDQRNVALIRAQTLEDDLLEARSELASMDQRLQAAHAETIQVRAQLNATTDRVAAEKSSADLLQTERDAVLARAVAAETELAGLARHISNLTSQVAQIHDEMRELSHVRAERDVLHAEYQHLLQRTDALEQRNSALSTVRAAQETRVQRLRSACLGMIEYGAAQVQVGVSIMQLARWLASRRIMLGLMRRSGEDRIAIVQSRANSTGIGGLVSGKAIAWVVRRRTLFGLLRRPAKTAETLISLTLIQSATEKQNSITGEITAAANDATLIAFLDNYLSKSGDEEVHGASAGA